jgi:hypothetical protein
MSKCNLTTYRMSSRGAPSQSEAVVEQVRHLAAMHTDGEIATELAHQGIQTAQGKPFTASRVKELRRRYEIHKSPTDSK